MSPGISITTRAIQTETESEHEASEDDDPQSQPLQQQEDTAEIAVQPSTSAPTAPHLPRQSSLLRLLEIKLVPQTG